MAPPRSLARPDTFDMLLVHRVFERELSLLPGLVRGVKEGDVTRAAIVASHYRVVVGLLQHHQSGEEAVIWPKLRKRAALSADAFDRMAGQLTRVHELQMCTAELTADWESIPTRESREPLSAALESLAGAAHEQLTTEVSAMLPLIERHLSPAEWNELGESGQKGRSRRHLLLTLGLMLEDATPADRTQFLAKLPGHARAVWHLYGRASYRRYVRRVRG